MQEVKDMELIIGALSDTKMYDSIMLNFPHARTLPSQLHFHLVSFINNCPIKQHG